jgi:hypothetical protein
LMDGSPLATRAAVLLRRKLLFALPSSRNTTAVALTHFIRHCVRSVDEVTVSVADVIRYFAHVDGAVHAGEPKTPAELAIAAALGNPNAGTPQWPLTALRAIGQAVLQSLGSIRDALLRVDRFSGTPGATVYLGIVLRSMGGDRENILLDLGQDRHRGRLTIFLNSDDRLCARVYDSSEQRIIMESPPAPFGFRYDEPFALEVQVGVLSDDFLVRVRTDTWTGLVIRSAQAGRDHGPLDIHQYLNLVVGSDLESVGRSNFSVCTIMVYSRVQEEAAYARTHAYVTSRATSNAVDWIDFTGDKFMYNRGHGVLSSASDKAVGTLKDLVQSNPARRPTFRARGTFPRSPGG